MSVRLLVGSVLGCALVYYALSSAGSGPGLSDSAFLIGAAQAQSAQQNPFEKARTAVET